MGSLTSLRLSVSFSDVLSSKTGDTPGDFIRRSQRFGTSISFPDYVQAIFRVRVRHFDKLSDKIAQFDWLTLVAIRSDRPLHKYHVKSPKYLSGNSQKIV